MHLKKRLSSIQDKQKKNNKTLTEQERFEGQLEAFHQREKRLFDWLHNVWGKDKEIRVSLEHDRLELQHEQQDITRKIHDKKQVLRKEKRNLLHEEDEELAALRRAEIREEKS